MGQLTVADIDARLAATDTFRHYRYWQTEHINDVNTRDLDRACKIDGFIYPTDHPGAFMPVGVRHQTRYDYQTVTLRRSEVRRLLSTSQPQPQLLIHCYKAHTLIADLVMIRAHWHRIPREWLKNGADGNDFLVIHKDTLIDVGALWD